jgi:hypothetical protein
LPLSPCPTDGSSSAGGTRGWCVGV